MDALVLWQDGSKNVVDIKELISVDNSEKILKTGCKVKMYYKQRWYYGEILDTEDQGSVYNYIVRITLLKHCFF